MNYYYLWMDADGVTSRESMTLYTDLLKAMDGARAFERFGFTVQVRNARTGELVAK